MFKINSFMKKILTSKNRIFRYFPLKFLKNGLFFLVILGVSTGFLYQFFIISQMREKIDSLPLKIEDLKTSIEDLKNSSDEKKSTLKEVLISLTKINVNNDQIKSSINSMEDDLTTSILAEKAENLTQNLENDQEKCIAIAKWISSHIANNNQFANRVFNWFASRSGFCGARAQIFVKMLNTIHIPARVFNIYNFPYPGGGHSCVQAFYNNKWHFFDVTYAGYFLKHGNILSWEEIKSEAKNGKHWDYVVIFEETHDNYINSNNDVISIANNFERMKIHYYEKDLIINNSSYGFYKKDIFNLFIPIDMQNMKSNKLIFGKKDGDCDDLEKIFNGQKISMRIGIIGPIIDNFFYHWNFKHLEIGKTYSLKFFIYKKSKRDLSFWVKSDDLNIILGNKFQSNSDVWEIRFVALSSKGSLLIGYDDYHAEKNPQGLYLNLIEVEKLNITNQS